MYCLKRFANEPLKEKYPRRGPNKTAETQGKGEFSALPVSNSVSFDDDLLQVVEAWGGLPSAIKDAIGALVRSQLG